MVVILVTKNKQFKVFFKDTDNKIIDLNYFLNDSIVAEKWFKKVIHLQNIPLDDIESQRTNFEDLSGIYNDFCKFTNLKPVKFVKKDQQFYNFLHEIFEKTHEKYSKIKNNSIIYKFHQAIHYHQSKENSSNINQINIGWGTKEGPLTEDFLCNPYYESDIKKNCIYLPWSELGKRPRQYWKDKEIKDKDRFNNLCLPHITLRPKFFIQLIDYTIPNFENQFNQFFNQFKQEWIIQNKLEDWTEKDEYSAPLLAIPNHNYDLHNLTFLKLNLQ